MKKVSRLVFMTTYFATCVPLEIVAVWHTLHLLHDVASSLGMMKNLSVD